MKKWFLLLVVVSFCGLFAQGIDWNITGAGSRAMGMGGAFIGLADDATAISWNPAGLYQLERMEASVVTQFYSETLNFEAAGYSFDEGNETFVVNFASLAYPLKIGNMKITTAAALQRQLEVFSYTESASGWEKTSGAASTINIGAGSRFMNIFAAGLCANIWMGNYTYEFDYSGNSDEADGNFNGFNLGVGGMVDLNYMANPIPLRLGLSVKTPFELKIDEEYGETVIDMPLMLGFGASYRLGEFLTLTADFETKGYKDKIWTYYDEDGQAEDEDFISLHDLNQFRVGAEYLFLSDFAVIPLRAGFQNVPTTNSNLEGDQIVGSGFSFGTGLIFERFAIDIFSYYAIMEEDWGGFGDLTIERIRAGISGIFYF